MESQESTQKKYSLLVVDDEEAIRMMTSKVLNKLGYNAITADGGEEALTTIEKGGIDVIITDVTMAPKMNGDVMSKIIYGKASEGDEKYKIPIIVISGYEPRPGYDGELERAVANAKQMSDLIGVSDEFIPFLQKPYRVAQIKEKLEQMLAYKNNPSAPQPNST